MRKFGLIGKSLDHSFSYAYFKNKFNEDSIDARYYNFNLNAIEDIIPLLKSDLSGLNVTIPYKQLIFPFLDRIETTAFNLGAVNTIKISDGFVTGFNTDIVGFEESLRSKTFVKNDVIKSALILGTGGASKAVSYVLNNMGYSITFVSRHKGDLTYNEIGKELMESSSLIVNTTPLGTFPEVSSYPRIPYNYLSSQHLVYDLVYNPEKTLFLKKSEDNGAFIMNGLEMLKLQAEASWELWTSSQETNNNYRKINN